MKGYRGGYGPVCVVFIVIAIIITFFYTSRTSEGRYELGGLLFVHDRGIAEYSSSTLVGFPVGGNYDDLVNKEVYFYDNKDLKKGKLTSVSLSRGNFTIGDEEYDIKGFLGQPSIGIVGLGSVLDFITMKTVYICAILIPAIICLIYLVYTSLSGMFEDKKKKA